MKITWAKVLKRFSNNEHGKLGEIPVFEILPRVWIGYAFYLHCDLPGVKKWFPCDTEAQAKETAEKIILQWLEATGLTTEE